MKRLCTSETIMTTRTSLATAFALALGMAISGASVHAWSDAALGEVSRGAVPPIVAWYPAGANGRQFVYSRTR
jgi:hypothetical protein